MEVKKALEESNKGFVKMKNIEEIEDGNKQYIKDLENEVKRLNGSISEYVRDIKKLEATVTTLKLEKEQAGIRVGKIKTKTEKKIDDEFKRLGVRPHIFHFTKNVLPFRAITVADVQTQSWEEVFSMIKDCIQISENHINPATQLLLETKEKYAIYGIAVCDMRDSFSRQYGRNKAAGRLISHLINEREMEK